MQAKQRAQLRGLGAALTIALAFAAAPLTAAAQDEEQSGKKFGFVNITQVITQSDEGQKEAAALEDIGAEKQEELNARRQELEGLAKQYQESVESGEPDAELRERIKKLKRELERDVRQAQSDVDVSRKDRIQEIGAKAVQVVQEYARDNGYTAIFRTDGGQMVYVEPAVDVTDQVIEAYNEAHPVE